MFNILNKLDSVGSKQKATLTEDISKDTATKVNPESSMRDILTRLNETATPAGPKKSAMPGTHTMGKGSKDGQHPAHEYLVGGEEGECDEGKEQVDEAGEGHLYKQLVSKLEELLNDDYIDSESEGWRDAIANLVNDHGGNAGSEEYDSPSFDNEDSAERYDNDKAYSESEDEPLKDPLHSDEWNDEIPADTEDEQEDSSIANKWRKGGPKDDSQYESKEIDHHDPDYSDSDYEDNADEAEYYRDQEREDNADAHNYADAQDRADESVYEKYDPDKGMFVEADEECCDDEEQLDEAELDEEQLGAKQSFSEVFKSMEESEEEKSSRLEKELFTELDEPELTKNDNGKYNLNDEKK